jgi:NADH-quinone oxidoreductase E subunit
MDHECICSKETNGDDFTGGQWQFVDKVIQKFQDKPGALIPVLEEIQGITGYLPESVQRRVASGLNLPLSQVYGVATFYSFFTMKPRGKHQIRICLGTACHVRGAKRNIEHLIQALNVKPGECTENRQFSLEVVRCLGACGLAPVMLVDEDTHKQVKEAKLDQILRKYEDGSLSSEG